MHLEGKGQESVLTKINRQLSKDNPKFAKDWSLVSSWKYDIGWTISTLLIIERILLRMSCHMENMETFPYWEMDIENQCLD